MNQRLRSVVFLGLVLATASGLTAQTAMPAWFWKPLGPGWCEVFAKSSDEAVQAAAFVLTAYSRSNVLGSFQQFFDESLDDRTWRNTDYTYNFSQKRATVLAQHLEVKERYPVNLYLREYVYLVGPQVLESPPKSAPLEPTALARPEWADVVGETRAGRLRAVGDFTLKGNPSDAWVKAEELAVFQLLRTKQVDLGRVTRVDTDGKADSYSQMDWIELNFAMADIRVDGRWVDPQSGDALVLVSAPEASIRILSP
ncbi:MAG: hypothetical protein WCG80_02465 [Spirochaetales bacterium]